MKQGTRNLHPDVVKHLLYILVYCFYLWCRRFFNFSLVGY